MSAHDQIMDLKERMQRSIIGQEEVVERLLLTLLCNSNEVISAPHSSAVVPFNEPPFCQRMLGPFAVEFSLRN
jgi:hypothetical protein